MEKFAGAAGCVCQQLPERDRLPVLVDRCVGKALADGVRPLHLTRFDQSRDHRGRDALGDPAQVPAIADLKPHAAAFLPLPVGRRSHDFPVDHNHRGEANEFLLLAKVGDQVRERGFGVIGVNGASRRLFSLAALAGLGRLVDGLAVGPCHGDVFEGPRLLRPQRHHDQPDGVFWLVPHAGQDLDQVLLESLPPLVPVGALAERDDVGGGDRRARRA